MGSSASGIIFFGIAMGYEDTAPKFIKDFDEFLIEESGLPRWKEPGHSFDAQREFNNNYPVCVRTGGHDEYPSYFVIISNMYIYTGGWEWASFDPTKLVVDQEKLDNFKAWCKEHGIKGEPTWILTADYG